MVRSRYPREGHRLAPVALCELLKIPVPKKYLDRAGEAGLLLCDLDETAWERFGEARCRELAQEVVRAIGRAVRAPIPIGQRHIPAIPPGLTLADLPLEVRTINCLVAAGIHERPQDLHALTIDGLLGLRGFWVKSLVDVLTSLEYVIDHPEARRTRRTAAIGAIKQLRAAHRYPRPGHRLAPQTLKEVLLERVPAGLVRGTPLRRARLCDLDETVWSRLPPAAIARLAGLVVARAGFCTHQRAILRRRLPRPPKLMRLEDLRLENRTHNCLAREGFAQHPEELGKLTVGELLSIRSFGTKCLVDLLTALEARVAREGKLDSRLTAEAKALARMPEAGSIRFTDPRLGPLLRAMDSESSRIAEMVERLRRRRLDPPDPVQLRRQLRELRDRIEQLSKLPLEEELVQIFAPAATGRDRQIVSEYHGWDGRGGTTLEALGRKHALSRERIRQVCVRAIKPSRSTVVFAPVLDRSLRFLVERFPKSLERLQAEFDATGISPCRLSVAAVQQAATFLGCPLPLAIVEAGKCRLVVHRKVARLPPMIVGAARQLASNYGAASLRQLAGELAARQRQRLGPRLLRETLEAVGEFQWLDARRTWFRLAALPPFGLPGTIEKILAVAERIELPALHAALVRQPRRARRLPPRPILREFCRQMPQTRIEGRWIVSLPPRNWRTVLSGVERKMVQVLKQHGPIMERGQFEELCVPAGVNRFSFNAVLMSSPVIAQFGRSVYGLVGTKVDRKTVAAVACRRSLSGPSRVLKGYGQTAAGRPYLAYRLSKAAVLGGVVTVPAAMKRQLRGRFAIRGPDGRRGGTLVARAGCAWGLGPALRGAKAREGDHLLLLFHLDRREVRLRIGDEAMLEEVRPA